MRNNPIYDQELQMLYQDEDRGVNSLDKAQKNKISGLHNQFKKRRYFSLASTIVLISSTLFFGILIPEVPVTGAVYVELLHDAGNLDFKVDNHATLPFHMEYNSVQQSDELGGWLDETFFFFDQSQYEHTGVYGDIATGRKNPPRTKNPEFDTTLSDIPLSLVEDGVLDKSVGSFTKVKDINGQVNDIRLFQTAYSKLGEDWSIFQWTVQNLYDNDLTEVRFGLRFYACAGGDNADDKAYWEPTDKVYYIKDSGSAIYIGFASADPQNPINMYWDGSINNIYNDKQIYNASISSPHVSGFHNDLGCVVGWTDNETINSGLTLGAYESITRPLIIVGGTSYTNLLSSINSAREFYLPRTLMITEIADQGTPRVEIYNTASVPHDLTAIRLSKDSGTTFWSGGFWDVNPIPGNGYSVWTLAGGDTFDSTEGDTVGLYNTSLGLLSDEVAFGQEGAAPDPINNPLIGSISRTHISDWLHSLNGMTFGEQNNENKSIDRTPKVVLNEVMFNPSAPEYGFIELMYIGDTSIDIDGFMIFTDNYISISGSQTLDPSDPFFLIFRDDAPWLFDNQNMSMSKDNVYLYNNEGTLFDMVGWNTAHQINMTVTRIPDGVGSYQGYNNLTSEAAGWIFDANQTIPLVNIGPAGQFGYGDPGDSLWYNLTIINKMDHQELFNIFNQSLPEGWFVEIYSNFMGTKLTDSNADGSPDILIDALSSVTIAIKVTIPSTDINGDYGTSIITVFANSDPAISHYVSIESRLNPYLFPDKSITPSSININGTGYNEVATITLSVTGNGFGIAVTLPQDVVFVFDRSESMIQSEIDLAKQAMTEYVENMSSPDSGAVVHFDSNVVLMGHLTGNFIKLNVPPHKWGGVYV